MKKTLAMFGAMVLLALPALAGEWHTGTNNLCTDCHTMHFSMQHQWTGSGPVAVPGPAGDGNWLSATGPNTYLLKNSGNDLCTTCHNGQAFAPDVVEANINTSPSQGRNAGALNNVAGASPYQDWKGHSLGTTNRPPGYNGDILETGADPYPTGETLQCVSCHNNHGNAAYRNLGPDSWGLTTMSVVQPTYVIDTTNTPTSDVWINLASYTANSGSAATFNPYYDFANIRYNRNDSATGPTGIKTSNRLDTFCSACHGDMHGGPQDANIAGVVSGSGFAEFERHPTSQVTIGAVGGTHSNLTFYTGATTKTKVYTSDHTTFADASPGCISCHKAHGNQNPFGMFLLHGAATAISEQGGYKAAQVEQANGYGVGYMNLCGQCHGQGINFNE